MKRVALLRYLDRGYRTRQTSSIHSPNCALLRAAGKNSPLFLSPCRFLVTQGNAVILLDDPDANTTAPTGSIAEIGWHYQGDWGGFLGPPISPHFFISPGHFGLPGPLSY